MILIEHLVFRKGKWSNYNADGYDDPKSLPVGIAALGAIGAGWAGAVIGMSTVFFVGPIGAMIGMARKLNNLSKYLATLCSHLWLLTAFGTDIVCVAKHIIGLVADLVYRALNSLSPSLALYICLCVTWKSDTLVDKGVLYVCLFV